MRDVFVTLFFCYGAAAALTNPFYGAMLWVWIGLMNPHRLGWGFAHTVPFGMAAAAITVLAMMLKPRVVRFPRGATVAVLLCFILWMAITTVNAIHMSESYEKYIDVLKVLIMTLVVASVVRTRQEILGLIWVIVMSIGYFGIKGGIFTIRSGGAERVWGPPSSVVEGNNELAVALVICIPLMYFLYQQADNMAGVKWIERLPAKWIKRGLLGSIGLCAISAIGTQSRGAFLAIAAMGAMLWWRSKAKFSIGIVMVLFGLLFLLFMPDEWMARMTTIKTYDEDQSAMGRINAWLMAINIADDRFFGAGFFTATKFVYQMYAPDPTEVLVAHSIYFQVLGEHGYFGLLLYLLFWFLTYLMAGRLVRLTRGREDFAWAGQLGSMSKVSLVGFAVGGAFLSLAYWDMPYYIMVLLLCSELLVKQELKNGSSAEKSEPRDSVPNGLRSPVRSAPSLPPDRLNGRVA